MNRTRIIFFLVILLAGSMVSASQVYHWLAEFNRTQIRLATAEAKLAAPISTVALTLAPTQPPLTLPSPTATLVPANPISPSPLSPSRVPNTPTHLPVTASIPPPPARATAGSSVGSMRDNPAPPGQSVLWTGKDKTQFRLTLLQFYRGAEAWNRIKAANSLNPSPPTTWEFVLVQVRSINRFSPNQLKHR